MSELTHEDLIKIAKRYNGQIVNKYLKRPLTEEEIRAIVWRTEIVRRDKRNICSSININTFICFLIIVGDIPVILNDYRQKAAKNDYRQKVAKEEFKSIIMRELRSRSNRIRWGWPEKING